jgi:hypothetical protein
MRILFTILLSLTLLTTAHAQSRDAVLGEWTPRFEGWIPANSTGQPLWISMDGTPYRLASDSLMDPSGAPYEVYVITDRNGDLTSLPRSDRERLAWLYRRAAFGPMMGNHPQERELLRVLQLTIAVIDMGSVMVDKATQFQERAIQVGTIGTVAYATKMKAVLNAADDLFLNEMAARLREAPVEAARDWARADLRRNLIRIEDQIRFSRLREQGYGTSPDTPLNAGAIEAAYARGVEIYTHVIPAMELLLNTQDDPGAMAQAGRLIMVMGDTATTLGKGQFPAAGSIGTLIDVTNLVAEMATAIPAYAAYVSAIDTRGRSLAATPGGTGDTVTEAIRTSWILVPPEPSTPRIEDSEPTSNMQSLLEGQWEVVAKDYPANVRVRLDPVGMIYLFTGNEALVRKGTAVLTRIPIAYTADGFRDTRRDKTFLAIPQGNDDRILFSPADMPNAILTMERR